MYKRGNAFVADVRESSSLRCQAEEALKEQARRGLSTTAAAEWMRYGGVRKRVGKKSARHLARHFLISAYLSLAKLLARRQLRFNLFGGFAVCVLVFV